MAVLPPLSPELLEGPVLLPPRPALVLTELAVASVGALPPWVEVAPPAAAFELPPAPVVLESFAAVPAAVAGLPGPELDSLPQLTARPHQTTRAGQARGVSKSRWASMSLTARRTGHTRV